MEVDPRLVTGNLTPPAGDLFADVRRITFRNSLIKQVWHMGVCLWPDPWSDIWHDFPTGSEV